MIETPVVVSPLLPYPPSHGEIARRVVRHGLADVLDWLGEEPGPEPNEQTHMLWVDGQVLVSQETYDRLLEQIRDVAPAPRWSIVPNLADPYAPTLAELDAALNVSTFMTDPRETR